MSGFFRQRGWWYRMEMADVLRRSFSAVRSFILFHLDSSPSEADELRRLGTDSAIRLVLSDENGVPVESKLDVFRRLIRDESPADVVERHISELRTAASVPEEDIIRAFASFLDDERNKLMRFLLSLAAAADTPEEKIGELRRIFVSAGADDKLFSDYREETLRIEERHRRIIGSGAGIAVALVVILVFIAAAIWLRSVIFGLILAYILLPLEKFFERKEKKKSGFVYYLFHTLALPFAPLQKLSQRITRRSLSSAAENPNETARRKERRIITKAVAQTVLVVLIAVGGIGFGITNLTMRYVKNRKDYQINASVKSQDVRTDAAVKSEETKPQSSTPVAADAAVDTDDRIWDWIDKNLGSSIKKLEKNKVIRPVLEWLRDLLQKEETRKKVRDFLLDEKNHKEVFALLFKGSSGVFSFTADMLGSVIGFIVDLLLTVFFAMLFLVKLAEFCRDDDSAERKSEYLVRTVFNGSWLPDTGEVVVDEATRILSGIMDRIRIWARGYLTLVCVDATVYTIVFCLLRVPYFPVLGIIAGCGILLPYIGPVLSASLTLAVTLAFGSANGWQLAGILAAYLIYNGIIEQFILYPAVIGESLGLTTLETIVVVLLGAVIAGIPGMFLALPVASVLKYLIPQIIQFLKLRKAAREDSRANGRT